VQPFDTCIIVIVQYPQRGEAIYCVAALGDTAGEIAEVHDLLQCCVGSLNFNFTGAERRAFLTFAKPSDGTAVFENDAIIHTPELEVGEEGAFCNSVANLRSPTHITVNQESTCCQNFLRDGIGVGFNIG
jgi:hypothetical protein